MIWLWSPVLGRIQLCASEVKRRFAVRCFENDHLQSRQPCIIQRTSLIGWNSLLFKEQLSLDETNYHFGGSPVPKVCSLKLDSEANPERKLTKRNVTEPNRRCTLKEVLVEPSADLSCSAWRYQPIFLPFANASWIYSKAPHPWTEKTTNSPTEVAAYRWCNQFQFFYFNPPQRILYNK